MLPLAIVLEPACSPDRIVAPAAPTSVPAENLLVAPTPIAVGGLASSTAAQRREEPGRTGAAPAAPPGSQPAAPPSAVPLESQTMVSPPRLEPQETAKAVDPAGAVLTPELHAMRLTAQQRVLGKGGLASSRGMPYHPLDAEAGTSAETAFPALGNFVPIENEPALAHFHRALARLAAGEDLDGKVRILAFGASHTQADLYPGYLRAYLQRRFGDGGRGFVFPGRINPWHRMLDMQSRHQGLKVLHARTRTDLKDEPLGLFGAALLGDTGGSFAEITTADSSTNTQFQVHYQQQERGGAFTIDVDGSPIERVSTQSVVSGPAFKAFTSSPGKHVIRVQLHGTGPVRLFGIIAESPSPGIVIDTLGIGGSRMSGHLVSDEPGWVAAVRQRDPDLVMFAYGTNETIGTQFFPQAYEGDVRAVLERLRKAAPGVSCVLLSPFDISSSDGERRGPHAALLKALEIQRRVSKEFGCGFWDGYAFMGGSGSIVRWAMAKPPLAQADHIHLTHLGYVYMGVALGDALLRAYDVNQAQWLSSAERSP